MSDDSQFRAVYSRLASQLQFAPVGSAEYLRLLQEWQQESQPTDIQEFLFRRAKTAADLPQVSD
uniref:Uncharacterized protein n=1 Tax=Schlesneria paludicola TaxID=360056 RepID=A0A7C2P184_9PLAN